MATLEEIDAQLLALSNERDIALADFKARGLALKQQRDAALMQQKLGAMTDAEKDALRTALNLPPTQVIHANGIETNTQMGEIGAAL